MLKTKRLDLIQEYIIENGSVSLDELVEKFEVSKNTIRNDVQTLVETGDFKKIYGGVTVDIPSVTVPFRERQIRNQSEKLLISKMAAEYVEDGDIIFIDSGTTTVGMVDYIKDKELTIITNNIDFIVRALPYEKLNIYSTGGMVERKTNSLTSAENDEIIASYNINKAFLASTGLSIKNGVTNSLPIESGMKRKVVKRSAEVFLLVDESKFDKASLTTYCNLDEIDYLVTNKIPEEYSQYAEQNNIRVVLSEEKLG
ncbi:DeoR/GlpR transcriptional regulator [Oceanobacillus zhaokaii]|uniref:DeoR/GlpR transcriptional regulator n=1 Tax=Oceanobacillus zhaokaii TaxID=2052660 RepID=A0A345PKH0_9BACI|nr:DeoR/GlpR family DNA-binding transcription regulator [Oceanobacillus zhaokaii]AXI10500.1 DeoR/GlpR transcriptional regulator [Oceanobacillus zhaokaii]